MIRIADGIDQLINSSDLYVGERLGEVFHLSRARITQLHKAHNLDHVLIDGRRFFVLNERNRKIISQHEATLK